MEELKLKQLQILEELQRIKNRY